MGDQDLREGVGQADSGQDESGQEVSDGGVGVSVEAISAFGSGPVLERLGRGAARPLLERVRNPVQAIAQLGRQTRGRNIDATGGVRVSHADHPGGFPISPFP